MGVLKNQILLTDKEYLKFLDLKSSRQIFLTVFDKARPNDYSFVWMPLK